MVEGCGRLISKSEKSCILSRKHPDQTNFIVKTFAWRGTAGGKKCGKYANDDGLIALCEECLVKYGFLW